ncbi:hypothetical protein [Larsenimonas suaedae]|uniref:Nucleotidyl transferase AbiEii/AbiGii toxin family protein n=1 Tax=Larsenimonas suaedae TaxID=1851019 RepID=A0ABU1GRH1_9GAMM|nr:hypothetical protein [Larsenimonas suaedae]MCM2972585.1 hypothetical protein [Larsenimonas suaedae]MDR5894619.1 hypothetical protein [Larsenimonas suaedae]
MSLFENQRSMLRTVAEALGDTLLEQVAFVGGCTTGLLLTDDFTRGQVRSTDDVDIIVSVMSYIALSNFKDEMKKRGFTESSLEDGPMPICAMKLGDLRVDLMPDDSSVLGFSNKWYQLALETAEYRALDDTISIRVVSPPLFAATKLEAYKGRGNNNPLESHDLEDILNLVDGRIELVDEIQAVQPDDLRDYIACEFKALHAHDDFGYAVQSQACGDADRAEVIYERWEAIIRV